MMKGKFRSGVAGKVASSTLAYPGNPFRYSPKFPADESQQTPNVFDVNTIVQIGAADTTSSSGSTRPASLSVVLAGTEKSHIEPSEDFSDAKLRKKQTRRPSQICDEISSSCQKNNSESGGQSKALQTGKVIVKVVQNVEKDIQEIEPSCKEHIKEVNGPNTL